MPLMIEKLIALISRNETDKQAGRGRLIFLSSVIGMLANLLFAGAKFVIGLLANSVAVLSDAANNVADAVSSLITLAGLKLSQKAPDPKHPFGYGRIEYISGMVIASIVLFAGFEFLKTSIGRVFHPQPVAFAGLQLIVLGASLLGKLFLGRLNIAVGWQTDSSALLASGSEAMMDVFVSLLTIISAFVTRYTGLIVDGYAGIFISLFILYTGVQLIRETVSSILGERTDKKLADEIKNEVMKIPPITGAYDLILHNYGPVNRIGSLNLEFPDTMPIKEVYHAMQKAQQLVYEKFHIYLTLGLYPVNTYNQAVRSMQSQIEKIIKALPEAVGMHAFFASEEDKVIRFDVVADFKVKDYAQFRENLARKIRALYPGFQLQINVDLDYS